MEERTLSRDEVTCPVCYSFIVDPVTFPCNHNVCRSCYDCHIDMTSIYCPVCRCRLSVWARKAAKTNSFVNLRLKKMIERQFPAQFEAQQRRLEAEAAGVKTEDADDEVLEDFMKEEAPPAMDRMFAEPGEIAEEFGRLYSQYKEDWEKQKNEAELASETFIKENFTDNEIKILTEMERSLINQSRGRERLTNCSCKHRRSARLATKGGTRERCTLCANKLPPVSRIQVKIKPYVSQNSPQTNGNVKQGTPSESVPTSNKGASQKKKSHSTSQGGAVLDKEILKTRDKGIPCNSSSAYAQLNLKTSPIDSNHVLENTANGPTPTMDFAMDYVMASQPLIISTEEERHTGITLTFNLRSDIFEDQDHHPYKENVIPSSQRQHPAVTSNAVTQVSEQKAMNALLVFHDHSYFKTMEHRNDSKRIQDLRRKQEAKDRRFAKRFQKMYRFDYEAPRLRPRKSARMQDV